MVVPRFTTREGATSARVMILSIDLYQGMNIFIGVFMHIWSRPKLHGSPLLNFCIFTIYSSFLKKSLTWFRISTCQPEPFEDCAPLKMCQSLGQNSFLGSLQDGKSVFFCSYVLIRNEHAVWYHFYSYDVINSRQIASYDSIALNKLINTCIVINATVMYVKLLQLHQCCTQRTQCLA